MTRLTIRIDLARNAAFGPGKARLLELIDKTGSIRAAATAMDMSYRRAWLLVQDIEAIIGEPALERRTGGANGGGASLTKRGRTWLERYRSIEKRATRAVANQLHALTRMAAGAPPKADKIFPRRSKRRNS